MQVLFYYPSSTVEYSECFAIGRSWLFNISVSCDSSEIAGTNLLTNSDTPDTPPSPTHDTPFTETTLSTQRSPTTSGVLRRRVMVLASGQPIPHGRPYRYHLNGPIHMMTARKRVGSLPTHRLAMRHSVDYSSSDHFSLDDSSSSLSSETASNSPADALSDSASSRSSSDHSFPASPCGTRSNHRLCSLVLSVHRSSSIFERPSHDSSSAGHSRKRSRSPVESVPLSLPTLGALSYARADLLLSPKRIKSPKTATDLEDCSKDRFEPYVPKEVGLGVDFEDESSEPSRSRGADLVMDVDVVRSDEIEIDPKIQAEIDECFAYADALRDIGINARVSAIEGVQREQGRRIIEAESAITVLTERVAELERDKRRLRGTTSVEIAFSDDRSVRNSYFLYFETNVMKMPNTRSRASRTREAVNEQSDRRMAEALRVRDAVRNLRPLIGDEVEQEEVGGNGNGDRGNGNGGNRDRGNGNRGNGNGGNRNGVVELTRWFEKMEIVFHISNCPEKYQVKMVPNEEDIVKRLIRGLPDNIQGNVIAANPTRFQDAVRIANQLMDKKLQGYAARSVESKRMMESNPRDNRGQQPPFKR
ncbi:hypothetical protein Tco_0957551 [Tanacetum coccineum]